MTTPLSVGDVAPDFTLKDQNGQDVTLSSFKGAKNVVVVFYPFAFSGICTGELQTLRKGKESFAAVGARVLAISCDAMFSLRAFADQQDLDFDLLTDHWPHGEIARSYGVFDEQAGCSLRGTFVLDANGLVRWSVLNGIGEPREIADLVAQLMPK